MGQCFPGTTRARNTSSWMGYCARTWYPTDAYFQPRVRTSSRRCLPLIDPPRAVVPCRVSVRCRCGKDVRALQRPIECYGIREYKSFLERARGRSSDLSGFRRNGHRSYGNFRPRGRAPSETPYRATGTIHFFAPDFAAAAARGLVVEEFVDTGSRPRVVPPGAQQVAGSRPAAPDRSDAYPAPGPRRRRSAAACVDTL